MVLVSLKKRFSLRNDRHKCSFYSILNNFAPEGPIEPRLVAIASTLHCASKGASRIKNTISVKKLRTKCLTIIGLKFYYKQECCLFCLYIEELVTLNQTANLYLLKRSTGKASLLGLTAKIKCVYFDLYLPLRFCWRSLLLIKVK